MKTFSSGRESLEGSACNAILLVLLSIYQLGSGSISKGTTEHRTGHHLVFKVIRMTKRDYIQRTLYEE